jgi:hypothetical protein
MGRLFEWFKDLGYSAPRVMGDSTSDLYGYSPVYARLEVRPDDSVVLGWHKLIDRVEALEERVGKLEHPAPTWFPQYAGTD